MNNTKSKVSPALFILVIICFLLPFVDLSCSGQSFTLNGFDFITGTSVAGEKLPSNPLAVAAVVMALIGAALFFWKNNGTQIAQTVAGVLGFISLAVMKSTFERKIMGEADIPIQIEWRLGYYLAMLFFTGAVAYSLYQTFSNKSTVPADNFGSSASKTVCPHCHKYNESTDNWCQWCGGSLQAHIGEIQAGDRGQPAVPARSAMPTQLAAESVLVVDIEESPTVPLRTDIKAETDAAGDRGQLTMPARSAMLTQPAPAQPEVLTQPVVPTQPAAESVLVVDIGESSTVPLRTDIKAETDITPVAFLRVERIGRCELIPVLKREFIIGSHNGSDYQEHSGNLGPINARIEKADDNYFICNQQTDSITYLNDQRLSTSHIYPLQPGDIIRLGDVEYIFDLA